MYSSSEKNAMICGRRQNGKGLSSSFSIPTRLSANEFSKSHHNCTVQLSVLSYPQLELPTKFSLVGITAGTQQSFPIDSEIFYRWTFEKIGFQNILGQNVMFDS